MERARPASWIRLGLVCGAYFLLIALVFSSFFLNGRPRGLRNAQEGIPKIVREELGTINSEILQILCHGDRLYLLHRNGIVQVYTPGGTYQYAASFYAHPNGRFSIALAYGELVVEDRIGNRYYFHGDEFDRFVDRRAAGEERLRLNWYQNAKDYEIRGGSVWYAPKTGEAVCIVRGSGVGSLFRGNGSVILMFGAMVVAGAALHWPTRKKTEENAER